MQHAKITSISRTETILAFLVLSAAGCAGLVPEYVPPYTPTYTPAVNQNLEAEYKSDNSAAGLSIKVLDLKNPSEGRFLLKEMLNNKDSLVGLEAASVLAILGFKDGLDLLKNHKVMTNSNIEYFYAKAGLILLSEKIPENLQKKNSVFSELNRLIEKCLQ